ncbi:MAG: hypothetical protein C9356_12050 [Oleiphilus sp.]|nr:MAG: hypothetical protein C9356_12050 [Oleiphilus sp.]
MFGTMMLVLPLGLAPIIFFLIYTGFFIGDDVNQKYVAGKFRKGKTEFPTLLNNLLCRRCMINFDTTGTGIKLIIPTCRYEPVNSESDAREYIRKHTNYLSFDWVDHCEISNFRKAVIESNDEKESYVEMDLMLPTHVIAQKAYIADEMKDLGRTLVQGGHSGNHMSLLHCGGDNQVEEKAGKFQVRIDRRQEVPGIFDYRTALMSEKQITRNISNRLWNRAKVTCTAIDDRHYHGIIEFTHLG